LQLLAHYAQVSSIRSNPAQQATVFDAFVSAVYETYGLYVFQTWLRRLHLPRLIKESVQLVSEVDEEAPTSCTPDNNEFDGATSRPILNHCKTGRSQFQEWVLRHRGWRMPRLEITQDLETPSHEPTFTGRLLREGEDLVRPVQGRSKISVKHQYAQSPVLLVWRLESKWRILSRLGQNILQRIEEERAARCGRSLSLRFALEAV
jgi:dsRNA-specific ribonuclease